MVKEKTSAHNNPKAPGPFLHFEIIIIKRRKCQQFREIASKNVPRAGVSSGSFGPPTRHLPEAPLVAELTQEGLASVPHGNSDTSKQLSPYAWTRLLQKTSGAQSPGSSWQLSPGDQAWLLPNNTHPCANYWVICYLNRKCVSAPTPGADLQSDQAKDVEEWLALRSLPCLPQPSSMQDNAGLFLLISLAMSSVDKALLWECIAQSPCHLHPLAHKPCFVLVLHLEINIASLGLGRKWESSREGKEAH